MRSTKQERHPNPINASSSSFGTCTIFNIVRPLMCPFLSFCTWWYISRARLLRRSVHPCPCPWVGGCKVVVPKSLFDRTTVIDIISRIDFGLSSHALGYPGGDGRTAQGGERHCLAATRLAQVYDLAGGTARVSSAGYSRVAQQHVHRRQRRRRGQAQK